MLEKLLSIFSISVFKIATAKRALEDDHVAAELRYRDALNNLLSEALKSAYSVMLGEESDAAGVTEARAVGATSTLKTNDVIRAVGGPEKFCDLLAEMAPTMNFATSDDGVFVLGFVFVEQRLDKSLVDAVLENLSKQVRGTYDKDVPEPVVPHACGICGKTPVTHFGQNTGTSFCAECFKEMFEKPAKAKVCQECGCPLGEVTTAAPGLCITCLGKMVKDKGL